MIQGPVVCAGAACELRVATFCTHDANAVQKKKKKAGKKKAATENGASSGSASTAGAPKVDKQEADRHVQHTHCRRPCSTSFNKYMHAIGAHAQSEAHAHPAHAGSLQLPSMR